MTHLVLLSLWGTVLLSGSILLLVRPKLFTLSGGGTVQSEIALAALKDIANVSRCYRWLGLVSTLMLVLSFPCVIFFVYRGGLSQVTGLTAVFEGILFILIRLVFKRVDRYENLLRQNLAGLTGHDMGTLPSSGTTLA